MGVARGRTAEGGARALPYGGTAQAGPTTRESSVAGARAPAGGYFGDDDGTVKLRDARRVMRRLATRVHWSGTATTAAAVLFFGDVGDDALRRAARTNGWVFGRMRRVAVGHWPIPGRVRTADASSLTRWATKGFCGRGSHGASGRRVHTNTVRALGLCVGSPGTSGRMFSAGRRWRICFVRLRPGAAASHAVSGGRWDARGGACEGTHYGRGPEQPTSRWLSGAAARFKGGALDRVAGGAIPAAPCGRYRLPHRRGLRRAGR